jgi:hypothetical protein
MKSGHESQFALTFDECPLEYDPLVLVGEECTESPLDRVEMYLTIVPDFMRKR